MTAFSLENTADGYPLSTGKLAKLIAGETNAAPPTTQTIRNHVKRGTITSCRWVGKHLRFDANAVQEYLANAPSTSHGGKRSNAGRKPSTPPADAPLTSRHADAAELRATIAQRAEDKQHPADAVTYDDVIRMSRAELLTLAWVGLEELGLNTAAVSRIKEIQLEQAVAMKLAKERGELVKASDLAAAWSDSCQRIIESLAALPKRASGTVASVAWVPDETIDQLCSMLHHADTDPAAIDEARTLLARPADHRIRIRAAIDAELARVRDAIADAPPAGLLAG